MSFWGKVRDFFAGLNPLGSAKHIDPPVVACADGVAALEKIQALGATFYHTSGTPSMLPLIPSPAVSMLAVRPAKYDPKALLGRVLVYRAGWHPSSPVCHRAVLADSYGLVMSGDNNAYSEPMERVTAANLIGEVVGIFTYPQT